MEEEDISVRVLSHEQEIRGAVAVRGRSVYSVARARGVVIFARRVRRVVTFALARETSGEGGGRFV